MHSDAYFILRAQLLKVQQTLLYWPYINVTKHTLNAGPKKYNLPEGKTKQIKQQVSGPAPC